MMKRRDLINKFLKNGWYFLREGSDHTIYTNGIERESISRQNEINEILAKRIIKRRGLK